MEDLQEDLEWKIIYVGSAESAEYDQVLDSVLVGPLTPGRHMFVFEAESPKVNLIPIEDVIGVTVVLLTCSYRKQEFIRVGYYVNNDYSDPELRENPPATPQYELIERSILATKPRVTRFQITWDKEEEKENADESGVQLNSTNINESTMDAPAKENSSQLDDNCGSSQTQNNGIMPINGNSREEMEVS